MQEKSETDDLGMGTRVPVTQGDGEEYHTNQWAGWPTRGRLSLGAPRAQEMTLVCDGKDPT